MPRYIIIEKRAFKSGILIEAADEEAAQRGDGDVLDEGETDSWADELLSCEEVSDDTEDVGNL